VSNAVDGACVAGSILARLARSIERVSNAVDGACVGVEEEGDG
jgi:hypothetical protein